MTYYSTDFASMDSFLKLTGGWQNQPADEAELSQALTMAFGIDNRIRTALFEQRFDDAEKLENFRHELALRCIQQIRQQSRGKEEAKYLTASV